MTPSGPKRRIEREVASLRSGAHSDEEDEDDEGCVVDAVV